MQLRMKKHQRLSELTAWSVVILVFGESQSVIHFGIFFFEIGYVEKEIVQHQNRLACIYQTINSTELLKRSLCTWIPTALQRIVLQCTAALRDHVYGWYYIYNILEHIRIDRIKLPAHFLDDNSIQRARVILVFDKCEKIVAPLF